MAKSYARENARLRREIALLRKAGAKRETALFNAIHVKGSDVASASTITLVDPLCDVTGSTTITAINSAPEGQRRTVRFTGALTLTYNATSLILPGAANITTAANDMATFYSLGDGNWICEIYTLASGTVLGTVPITKGGTGQTSAGPAKDALTVDGGSVASAATTDIGAATGEFVTITGTTTITSFGTKTAGVKRSCKFADALTLTHNATSLILPTGANITTAANDVAVMRSLGSGNWICESYTLANGTVLGTVPITKGGTGATSAGPAKDALTVDGGSIASAATTDIGAATGEFVTITGTTTITSFGTKTAGVKRSCKFAAALTLTHNATSLILPTGANITTAANDVAVMRSLGSGNWICESYTLANGTVLGTVPITKGGTGATTAVAGKDALTVASTDIASAATTDLSTATGEAVRITGTTTITAFGTVSAGARRVLTFAGALTLTHNATSLILPTAANITTAAGDVAEMLSLGSGNWRCIKYTKADGQVLTTVTIAKGGTGATTAIAAKDALTLQSSNIASASTVDLSAATGEYVTITGSTTINAFAAQTAGNMRILRFSGTPTVTYNSSSMILPGGASITAQVGDRAIFVSEGSGNWRCIVWQRDDGANVPEGYFKEMAVRLTGTSLTPFTTSDVTAATAVYATPCNGNKITVYRSSVSAQVPVSFAELNLPITQSQTGTTTNGSTTIVGLSTTAQLVVGMAVSGTGIPVGATISAISAATTVSLSAAATASGSVTITFKLPANSNFDVYATLVNDAMALRCGMAWTNDTTRSTPLQLMTGAPFWCNLGALGSNDSLDGGTPNRINSGAGAYLGTIRTTGTAGQIEDSVANRFIWNAFNRAQRPVKVVDTTNSWNYSTATWRQANGSTANQVAVVVGLSEDMAEFQAFHLCSNSGGGINTATGIGIDATNANSALVYGGAATSAGGNLINYARYLGALSVGYHYIAWLEISQASGTTTWRGDNGVTYIQTGLSGWVWA